MHLVAEAIIATARAMNQTTLNTGTSGNVSARVDEGMLITPSGIPYDVMTTDQIVLVGLDGSWSKGQAERPSSEWRFHLDFYRQRHEVEAVVHAHPVNATALAVHGRGIGPFHYMVAIAGGHDIRCAPYATFGTQNLSDSVVAALHGRFACLMAHHGVVACGRNLDHALSVATEVETLAAQYLAALQLGEPPLLSSTEIEEVLAKMASGVGYGSS